MAQIKRTTNDLIISSMYLIGELGVGEIPDAFMLSTGLEIINEILDSFAADSIYIAYLSTVEFTFQPGKSTYSVSDIVPSDINQNRIVDISFAEYTVSTDSDQPITYPLEIISKAEYYNMVRLKNLQSRPGVIFLDKQPTQSLITVYPAPDRAYTATLQVKSMVSSLDGTQTLEYISPYYYGFLKYAVARELRSYYPSSNWSETAEDKYQNYLSTLKSANETDLTIRSSSLLTVPSPYFWWQNILAY